MKDAHDKESIPKSYERIYLTDIHENLDQDSLLDLHTYFWSKELLHCPICHLRLFMKKEELFNERH